MVRKLNRRQFFGELGGFIGACGVMATGLQASKPNSSQSVRITEATIPSGFPMRCYPFRQQDFFVPKSCFDGKVSNITMYSSPLSDTEIEKIHNKTIEVML